MLRPHPACLQCAVSLDWLVNTFLDENPRVNGFTTQEVMTQIVKPRTAAGKMRYVEWLLQQGDAHRDVVSGGKQYYFISHGWARWVCCHDGLRIPAPLLRPDAIYHSVGGVRGAAVP